MNNFNKNKPATLKDIISKHWAEVDKKQASCEHGVYRFVKYNSGGGKLICRKCNKAVDTCISPAAWAAFKSKYNLEFEF